jgi:hypothetical protein
MRVHQLSTVEMVVMVLAIVVSLAAMEAVIFVFGARSYKRHKADRKDGEAQDVTQAGARQNTPPGQDPATSARDYASQYHDR